MRTFLTFAVLGGVAGLASGAATVLRPLGLILPGGLFGIAMCCALRVLRYPTTRGICVTIVLAAQSAYWVAVVVCIWVMRFGSTLGWLTGATAGFLGGGAGAFVVSVSVAQIEHDQVSGRSLAQCALVGGALGAVCTEVGVYLSDHDSFGHPIDDFVTFFVWQVGVAVSLGRLVNGASMMTSRVSES